MTDTKKKEVQRYRHKLIRMLYDIGNVAILDCIYIVISDIAKEQKTDAVYETTYGIDSYMKNVRKNLRSEYNRRGITNLSAFSCQCETSKGELDKLLYGEFKKGVRLSTLITISNALGKSLIWLVGESEGTA